MNKYFATLLVFLFFTNALSKEERFTIIDSEGDRSKISLESYTNSNGVFEVRVDAAGIPRFLDKLNPTILYGRDLDGNNKIDTWFFITDKGIEVESKEGQDPTGKDILDKLITKKYQTTAMMYFSTTYTTIFSYLLLSADESINIKNKYIATWIDLEELKIRFENEQKANVATTNFNEIQMHHELLSFGYNQIANDLERFAKKDFWAWMGADIGLWVSGTILFKWGEKLIAKLSGKIASSSYYQMIKKKVSSLFTVQLSIVKNKVAQLTEKISFLKKKAKSSSSELSYRITKANFNIVLTSAIASKIAKRKLASIVLKSMKLPKNILLGAKEEWRYIALNASIQTTAETISHWDEVYDSNPLILAKNVLENDDIKQNIAFMTTDTILMTGLSKSLKTTKARFIANGFVGMTNSTTINLVIKGEENYERVALDTGWEMLVGNAQVQLDLKALEYFEKMAQKKNNPKIKLLGYAVAMIDQGIGYFSYSKVSEKIDNNSELPSMALVPILAEK